MFQEFQDRLEQAFPFLRETPLLLAVSGGVDSVVLTHLCRKAELNISLAHCNFNLRGEESDKDEQFVQDLADALELEVFIEHFDTEKYAGEQKKSIQVAARELRYKWFNNLQQALGFQYVLTAHHANDSLETFLINFLRGTGLDGLTGIPDKNEEVVRPLLPFSRAEIEQYARRNNLQWRDDSSNASTKYLRNKIRHDIIPALEEINPQLLASFQKTREHLGQSAALVEDYISAIFPKVARESKFGYSFNIELLQMLPNVRAVLYELFKPFGFTEWDDVHHLLEAHTGKMVMSATHRLIKDRNELLLTVLPDEEEEKHYEIDEDEDVLMIGMGTFHLSSVEEMEEMGSNILYVDKDKLRFPLRVRKWKEGDHFHPFGMQGTKKLSKFFKDNKLSLPEKENTWILCSGNDIVWVIGQRADARFSVDENTANILQITYTP